MSYVGSVPRAFTRRQEPGLETPDPAAPAVAVAPQEQIAGEQWLVPISGPGARGSGPGKQHLETVTAPCVAIQLLSRSSVRTTYQRRAITPPPNYLCPGPLPDSPRPLLPAPRCPRPCFGYRDYFGLSG